MLKWKKILKNFQEQTSQLQQQSMIHTMYWVQMASN